MEEKPQEKIGRIPSIETELELLWTDRMNLWSQWKAPMAISVLALGVSLATLAFAIFA